MAAVRASAIALHVEAAKRLLRELEQHAEIAMQSIGRDGENEFATALDERARVLSELSSVVEALSQERGSQQAEARDPETRALLDEMAQAAAAALESHDRLVVQTQKERDRLATALNRTTRPDAVANQYAAATTPPRPQTLSVTG
jgi:hypothetical protein